MSARRPSWRAAFAAVLAFVAACAARRESESWSAANVAALEVSPNFRSPTSTESGAVAPGWIATFGDARLVALVDEALAKNSDVELAAARVDLAAAQELRARAGLKPELDVFADASRADLGQGASNLFDLGLRASWEPDVWGRLSSAQRAAALETEAAHADLTAARHALAAQTARSWFLAIAARERIAIDERSLGQRERVERITRARLDAGEAAASAVDISAGQSDNARQLLEQSRGARRAAQLALEALLGRYPSGELETADELPPLAPPPPVGLPSELLERRPDVRAAERSVAAAFERVEAAEAARLPRIVLTAQGGFANDELHDLLDPSQRIWSLGAGLLAPLFDGGRLLADADAARAVRRAALANYVGTARGAFLEVELALTAEAVLRSREAVLGSEVERFARARESAEERYVQGELTILELDQIHDQLYQAERDRLQTRVELALARVVLHLALGGSFAAQP